MESGNLPGRRSRPERRTPRKPVPVSWGERMRRLESYARSAGKTQAQLAAELGITARTFRRWKQRTDLPESARAGARSKEVGDRITRRERYRDRERPEDLRPVVAGPRTADLTQIPVGENIVPGDVLAGVNVAAFSFTPSSNPDVAEAIALGRRVTFYVGFQDPIDFGPFEVRPITIETRGLTPADVNRTYFGAVRAMLDDDSIEAVAAAGSDAVAELLGVAVQS